MPTAPKPLAVYIPTQQTGNLVYTSGQLCKKDVQLIYEGEIGKDLTIEQGKEAARQAMVNCLAVLKDHIGDLDKIKKIVKIQGFVNSSPGFFDQENVINGASELLSRRCLVKRETMLVQHSE